MKILHIAECAGGVERYLQLLIPLLKKLGFRQSLLCSNMFTLSKFCDNIDEVFTTDMQRTISPLSISKTIREIRQRIISLNPDIIYCHSSIAGFYGRMASLGLCRKIVYNPHGWSFNMLSKAAPMYLCIERIMANITDMIVCISKAERKSALDRKVVDVNKLCLIENGIDINQVREAQPIMREKLGIPKDAYVVGMVGRIAEQKSPDIFVKAAKIILQNIPNAFFIIVGDGLQREKIEKISQEDCAIPLLITGWVDNPYQYLKIFDVAMLLSRWEGFGYSIVEYMAAGVPLVATNVDAIPTIVSNGSDGILVEKDDYQEAARSVIKIHNDITSAEKFKRNALLKVSREYSVQRVAYQHAEMFEKLVNEVTYSYC